MSFYQESSYFHLCFNGFSTHSLEQQQRAALLNRVDDKYLIRLEDLASIVNKCKSDYTVLSVSGRQVIGYATCYYDTPDMMCFTDHHNGVLPRYKIRTRQYSSGNSQYLEIKTKTNKFRTIKERVSLTQSSPEHLHQSALLPGDFRPVLDVTYQRTTLMHVANEERVTFDHNLQFRNVAGNISAEIFGTVIVEVKRSQQSSRSPMTKALREAGYRPVNFSKYCNGCLLTEVKGIKRNRFKWQLAALKRTSSFITGVAS